MICPQCQRENLPDSIFCDRCGMRFETVCSHCDEPNRLDATFCRICGQLIDQTATTAPARVSGVPTPDSYVPKHLAEKILASRQSLEGERKQVTVLFADIRGSTSLLEGLDPEEAQKLIDPVLRVMMDAVHRYEGTVNQVLGDGIMALFGAPLAHEDHALRACYTALAMQEEMRRYRRKLGQSEETGLQIGIGLNSGEVVVRSISNDLNVDYSALGHTTHMAARMQEIAAGGITMMTASTLRQVEGFVQVKAVGAVQVKGVSRPVESFEVVAATAARTRVQAAAVRGLTPLVGRRTETEVFSKLVEEAGSGKGQILAMVGEPGLGKSRLVHEFTRHQLRPGWLVLEGASVSYGKATPYFPLIEMLRRYFQIADGEGREDIREQVVMHILELDNMFKDAIPPMLSLLGALPDEVHPSAAWTQFKEVVDATERYLRMDPQQRRPYTLDAIKRVLVRESQRQPLLIVFEDLHWIDSETQAFLDSFVESLPMARIVLLVDYRPEYSHSWGDKTYYTQIRVDPLQPASAEELLQYLLGSNKDLAPLKELLMHRTEGNPFFAEESVRSLVETGVLVGEKGAYRPGLRIDEIRIPNTIQNVLADRIDRLPLEEKRLLQTAAVIGMIVPLPLLRAVAELPEDDLRRYVSHLQTAEFLYETNLFPEVEYSFKHALTTEVAYGALLHERRTTLHGLIVKALEEMTENIPHDHLEQLAHHAFQGELWEKAVLYQGRAGTKALACSANREAVGFFDKALDALHYLPRTRKNLEKAVDLRLDLRNALFLLGEFARIRICLSEAHNIAENLRDPYRLRRVWNLQLSYFSLTGEPDRALELGERALALEMDTADPGADIVTKNYMGIAYHVTGNYFRAIDLLKHTIAAADEEAIRYERFGTSTVLSVSCRNWVVQSLAQTGVFNEGINFAQEGIQLAEKANHPYSLAYINCSLGFLLVLKGDLNQAVKVLQRCQKFCQDANIRVLFPQITSYLGFAYALSGRTDEALPLLQQAESETLSIGRISGQSLRVNWQGEAYLMAGRLDEAALLAQRGFELSEKHRERGHGAWSLKLLGEVASCQVPPNVKESEAYYSRALLVANELGMRPLQAHCHCGLGRIWGVRGLPDQARAEFSAAVDLYRSMEMTLWLNRADAALRNIGL
jgi:class 3 adenylate cyclase/tetratricopeptide (TPR) repeat protein